MQISRFLRRVWVWAVVAVLASTYSVARQPAQAQAAAPSPAAAAFAKGVQLHDGGKPAEAIEPFKQAIALGFQPLNQARFRLARSYARSGDPDKALAELEGLAAAGFQNVAVLSVDLDSLRALPRFIAFQTRVKANAQPCDADPNFRKFDFWIGEWDVQPTGQPRGPMGSGSTSIVERQLAGCVIQENWLPVGGGGAGKSFNIYNSTTKQWEQHYVDARGTITVYKGSVHDDGGMYFEVDSPRTGGRATMTFFNQGPDQVRQLGQNSSDEGKTWTTTFDLTYLRKPSTAAKPMPHILQTPQDMDWRQAGPATGLQVIRLSGDPSRVGEPFALRLHMPDGYLAAPHWHPVDEHVVVVLGTAIMGSGDVADRAKAHDMPVGSYGMMPKDERHYFWAKGETVLQVWGVGPFTTNWIK
ncbi:MAG: hypothetical protein ABIP90_12465 [Vicinamibacterales bacterium]